jgi:hypothetical protein
MFNSEEKPVIFELTLKFKLYNYPALTNGFANKPELSFNNFNIKNSGDWVKVNLGKKYIANTYDIEVDNETNLYLLSSGLVTHNSCHLAIIDEAGFTDDLKQIVLSVIMPSTGPTEGKILLATTPPDETDHEFNFFKEQAEESGNIVVKTIEDYFEAFIRAKK